MEVNEKKDYEKRQKPLNVPQGDDKKVNYASY